MHLKIHTDGGARGNPGPAALGYVLEYDGKKEKFKKFLGVATNNQAEYEAIIAALSRAKALKAETVDLYSDSELIVNQLSQKYKVKDKNLAKLFVKVWNLTLYFKKIKFIHIYREANKQADALVNEALDAQSS